jgi:Uncharacterized protein conserved in bacteria (DUF2213)
MNIDYLTDAVVTEKNFLEPRSNEIIFWANIARVADNNPLVYRTKTGKREEYIVDADLFDPKSLESLMGVPVIDVSHPPSAIRGERKNQKGVVLQELGKYSLDSSGVFLTAPVLVWDSELKDKILTKKNLGISPGYNRKVSLIGDRLYQKDRQYDHILAITNPIEQPRNGTRNTTLIADSEEDLIADSLDISPAPIAEIPSVPNENHLRNLIKYVPLLEQKGIKVDLSWTAEQLNDAVVNNLVADAVDSPIYRVIYDSASNTKKEDANSAFLKHFQRLN